MAARTYPEDWGRRRERVGEAVLVSAVFLGTTGRVLRLGTRSWIASHAKAVLRCRDKVSTASNSAMEMQPGSPALQHTRDNKNARFKAGILVVCGDAG